MQKRRLNIAVFSYTSQDREPSPVFFYFNNTFKMPYKKNIEISIMWIVTLKTHFKLKKIILNGNERLVAVILK